MVATCTAGHRTPCGDSIADLTSSSHRVQVILVKNMLTVVQTPVLLGGPGQRKTNLAGIGAVRSYVRLEVLSARRDLKIISDFCYL